MMWIIATSSVAVISNPLVNKTAPPVKYVWNCKFTLHSGAITRKITFPLFKLGQIYRACHYLNNK